MSDDGHIKEASDSFLDKVNSKEGLTPAEALQKAGGMGRMQWFSFVFGCLCFNLTGYLYYNLSYLELFPKYSNFNNNPIYPFICYTSKMDKVGTGCLQKEACALEEPAFFEANPKAEDFLHNWASKDKLNLYCTNGGLIGLIGSMYFAGWVTSLLFIPAISDRKGRKWFSFTFTAIEFVIFIYLYFTHNLIAVIVCMYLIGFGLAGKSTLLYVYMLEVIPENYHTLFGSILNFTDGSTLVWTSIYFVYVPYWKPFYIFATLMHLVVLGALLFIPESPIVLYENERYKESKSVYQYIAKVNGKKDFDGEFQFDREVKQANQVTESPLNKTGNETESVQAKEEKVSFKALLKNKTYLINLVVMTILWTVSSFDYYMINFQLKHIHGNTFLNTGFSSFSEVFAYLLGGVMVKKLGTKLSFMLAFGFSVLGSLLIIFIPATSVSQITFASFVLSSKFGVSATFVMVYIVTANYFPASLVGTAFGFCNLFARAFSFLSPEIAEIPDPWPMLIFCIAAIGASIATMFLKDIKTQDQSDKTERSSL